MTELITKKQAQKLLKVSERTLNNYLKEGLLTKYYPKGKSGKTLRLNKTEVENFFQPEKTNLNNS